MAEIDLTRYLRVAWRWRWLILLAAMLAAGASLYAVRATPRIYRTSILLMVGEDTANPAVRQDDLLVTQRAMVSYMGMARRQPVLEATVDALRLPIGWRTLQDQVVVVRVEGSNVFEIRVVDTSPDRVAAIADELARQLVLQSPTLTNIQQGEERRRFVQRQLDDLQGKIQQAEADLADRQAALGREVSARGVLERQDEIQAIEAKINNWRTSYAALVPAITQTRAPNNLTIIERAYRPTEPVSPNVPMTVALAIAVGILLAIGAAFVLEFADDTLRGPDDAARALALPVVGAIPTIAWRRDPQRRLVARSEPLAPASEAYRMLRTFAELAGARDQPIVLLITSPGLGEGKSLTCANLAVSFAQAGRRTILVDGDLRHPSLHQLFGLPNLHGLATLLATDGHDGPRWDDRPIEAALATTGVPNLQLMTGGPIPPNPAELLGSRAMAQVMTALRAMADVVVIDSPPALPVADAAILAASGVQSLLLVQVGKTRTGAARRALDTLRRAKAQPLGVVLNRVRPSMLAYHAYPPPAGSRFAPRLRLIRRG